jgi:hypothetical protein
VVVEIFVFELLGLRVRVGLVGLGAGSSLDLDLRWGWRAEHRIATIKLDYGKGQPTIRTAAL